MQEAFSVTPGELTKYTTDKKQIRNCIHFYQILHILFFCVCFAFSFWVFRACIDKESKLSDTIALGSIFATFGSSIVAIFSITVSNEYDKFNNNLSILFTDIIPECRWYRWPFIKRESFSKLYNNEFTYQILKNAEVRFNVGSHIIHISLPTSREDFYDLKNWKSFLGMFFNAKDYESYVLNQINEPSTALMVWNCILSNFKAIAVYKMARAMIVIGESFIFSSIILAFFYFQIPF